MSDESKIIDIQNYFEQAPYGWRAIAIKLKIQYYAPYYFQVRKDANTIAIVFIQRCIWDNVSVLANLYQYDVINYINQNEGQRIVITTKGLEKKSD